MRRVDVHPVVLVAREHCLLPRTQLVAVLADIGRRDREQRLLASVRVDMVLAGAIARRWAGDAAIPSRNGAISIAGLLRTHRSQLGAELCSLVSRRTGLSQCGGEDCGAACE